MIITIDGPTASGKSSLAKAVAKHLNFYYLNTGLLYRAVTYALITYFGYTSESLHVVQVADLTACTSLFEYTYDSQDGAVIYYSEKQITPFLKDAKIDMLVCIISPQPLVRDHLSQLQRLIAQKHDVVVEGRDVGSVVFVHADYKFYLTASLQVRAQRWRLDQAKQGNIYTINEAEEKVSFRDAKDTHRSYSPLVIPEGAMIIDNSNLNFQETVVVIIQELLKNSLNLNRHV